ncbi:hypothetical protein STIAU_3357 [Stigmatella aurantiaca DW4/3-1]|uniref:Uncharacterized protein n=1 Tax=Stigmatella aurantiaca (strain DW4/3-1) TaxID=378806 RepID=Q099J1_STIAD|nr:hypothetical protein STIAU_3357 [Stigmatella aurantiaca DW4/3-1]
MAFVDERHPLSLDEPEEGRRAVEVIHEPRAIVGLEVGDEPLELLAIHHPHLHLVLGEDGEPLLFPQLVRGLHPGQRDARAVHEGDRLPRDIGDRHELRFAVEQVRQPLALRDAGRGLVEENMDLACLPSGEHELGRDTSFRDAELFQGDVHF